MNSPNSPASLKNATNNNPSTPWPLISFMFIVLCTVIAALWRRIDSSDVLFHLKAGQVVLRSDQLPNRDIFSSTSSVGIWVYFEWLWGVILAFAWKADEWLGINLLNIGIAVSTTGFLLLRSRKYDARWFEILFITAMAMIALLPVFQPTPTMAVLPIYVCALILIESKTRRWPLIIFPILAAFWANFHIGAPLIMLLPLARAVFPDSPTPAVREPIRRSFFLMVAAATFIGLMITPHSFSIVEAWFNAARLNAETMIPRLTQALAQPAFLIQIMGAVALYILSIIGRSLSKWHHLLTGALLTSVFILSPDNVVFIILLLTGPASQALSSLLTKSWTSSGSLRWATGTGHVIMTIAFAAVTIFTAGITPDAWGKGVRNHQFPEMPAGRLAAIPLRVSILNTPEDASYLLWRLWPGWKVTVDERAGFYDSDFRQQYASAWRGDPGWEGTLSLWNVNAVLGTREILSRYPGRNLYHALAESEDWQAVYWDNERIMYLKSNIDLSNSNLSAFRHLKPGLPWEAMKARLSGEQEWMGFAADLRKTLLDDPANPEAIEFLRRAEQEIGKL